MEPTRSLPVAVSGIFCYRTIPVQASMCESREYLFSTRFSARAAPSGRIRRSFIRILPGDRVKIEVSRYDSTRGPIIYRLRNKDSNN